MKKKLKWGVLSTAKIAREKVIPAMANSDLYEVYGIASRDLDRAKETAKSLGIPKAYGSYEELINDPEIDVIYNPLPNDMHVPYTLKWMKARELVRSGYLGKIKAVQGFFSYFNDDKGNIRNIEEMGGGGVWDIGCYPVFTSRFVLDKEPGRLVSMLEFDPQFRTDKLGSVLLDFNEIQMTFTISTQLTAYQRMLFFGDKKILEVRIPFNAPSDQPNEIFIHEGDFSKDNAEKIVLPVSNQYTAQAIDFSKAIIEDTEVPVTLENTKANTKVLQAIFESDSSEKWVNIN